MGKSDAAAWFCRISHILCDSTLISAIDAPLLSPSGQFKGATLVGVQFSGDWCSRYQWGGFDIKPLRLFSTCVPHLWSMTSSQDGQWSPDWTSSGIRMLNNCPLNRGTSWIIHLESPIWCVHPRSCWECTRSGHEYESPSTRQSHLKEKWWRMGEKNLQLRWFYLAGVFLDVLFKTLMNKTNINADILLEQNINQNFRPVISPTFLSGWMSYSHSWCSTLTFWITSQRL